MNTSQTQGSVAATAWILAYSAHGLVAVGEFELVHVLDNAPKRHRIPRAPAHCRDAILWQDQVLPFMNLGTLAATGRADRSVASVEESSGAGASMVAIVGYHAGVKNALHYGAVGLHAIPKRALVSDEQACDLPHDIGVLGRMACACFRHPELGPVPVIDLPRLFTRDGSVAH